MTEQSGRDELNESRKAFEDAARANAETDRVIDEIHRTSLGIRVIVQKNGYVSRFREMLRGA